MTIAGTEYVVYGQPMVESFYSLAKKLENSTDEKVKNIANSITERVEAGTENDGDIGMGGDDLWG